MKVTMLLAILAAALPACGSSSAAVDATTAPAVDGQGATTRSDVSFSSDVSLTGYMTTSATGPDGSPGSSLAVGILVPMFGIGLNGLWCAFHGVFEPRVDPAGTAKMPVEPISTPGVAPDDRSIDKNEGHG